jgi:hypothetical protein
LGVSFLPPSVQYPPRFYPIYLQVSFLALLKPQLSMLHITLDGLQLGTVNSDMALLPTEIAKDV